MPNDNDREQFVDNDEGFYDWRRRSGLSMRKFIRQHRKEIDEAMGAVKSGAKPAHYLKYGSHDSDEVPDEDPFNDDPCIRYDRSY